MTTRHHPPGHQDTRPNRARHDLDGGKRGGMPMQGGGMLGMAQESERHYRMPMSGAAEPLPNAFPPVVMRGLALGVLFGALAGLFEGWLLWNVVAVPGWEALYSDGRFTFYVFWMFMGVGTGILLGGVGAVLAARPQPYTTQEVSTHDGHEAAPRRRREPEEGSPAARAGDANGHAADANRTERAMGGGMPPDSSA